MRSGCSTAYLILNRSRERSLGVTRLRLGTPAPRIRAADPLYSGVSSDPETRLAVARSASIRATWTPTPSRMPQASASLRATCGSSGCSGGSLPVIFVQAKMRSLRAPKAAANPTTPLTTLLPPLAFLSDIQDPFLRQSADHPTGVPPVRAC